jgi:hypothetical protein
MLFGKIFIAIAFSIFSCVLIAAIIRNAGLFTEKNDFSGIVSILMCIVVSVFCFAFTFKVL